MQSTLKHPFEAALSALYLLGVTVPGALPQAKNEGALSALKKT